MIGTPFDDKPASANWFVDFIELYHTPYLNTMRINWEHMISKASMFGAVHGNTVGAKWVSKITVHSITDCVNQFVMTRTDNIKAKVSSISFGTKKGQMFGPYGTVIGQRYALNFQSGCLSGIHGSANTHINKLGVYFDDLKIAKKDKKSDFDEGKDKRGNNCNCNCGATECCCCCTGPDGSKCECS